MKISQFIYKTDKKEYFLTFYEASVTLILKLEKEITRKENYRQTYLMKVDAKILNKALKKPVICKQDTKS